MSQRLLLRDLSYSVRGRVILDHVTLRLEPGRFVGLIGPNGAGKSTLLRLADGYLRPSGGQVTIDGRLVEAHGARELARAVAYLSQDMGPAFGLPVLDVVQMGRYAHNRRLAAPPEDLARARAALGRVGLADLEGRSFHELSTGERQLVLIARLLVQDTPYLLLDEPTASLDLAHRARIFAVLRGLADEGRGVLAAVHDLNEAGAHCSRLVLLDRGRVVAQGAAEEVLRPEVLTAVYRVRTLVGRSPSTGAPVVEAAPMAPG